MKKRAPAKVVKRIKKLVKAGKAHWKGDVGLLNKSKDGVFTEAKIDRIWKYGRGFGFVVRWGANGIGFGEITFVLDKGRLRCWSELMSRRFVKKALAAVVDRAIWEER